MQAPTRDKKGGSRKQSGLGIQSVEGVKRSHCLHEVISPCRGDGSLSWWTGALQRGKKMTTLHGYKEENLFLIKNNVSKKIYILGRSYTFVFCSLMYAKKCLDLFLCAKNPVAFEHQTDKVQSSKFFISFSPFPGIWRNIQFQ